MAVAPGSTVSIGFLVDEAALARLRAVIDAAPADVRRDMRVRARSEVMAPLAARLRVAAAGSNYLARLAGPTVRAVSADLPTITVGGSHRVASGGITAGQAAFAGEFGANREKRRRYTTRRGEVVRRTARQLPPRRDRGYWFVPTAERLMPEAWRKFTGLWATVTAKWERVG